MNIAGGRYKLAIAARNLTYSCTKLERRCASSSSTFARSSLGNHQRSKGSVMAVVNKAMITRLAAR